MDELGLLLLLLFLFWGCFFVGWVPFLGPSATPGGVGLLFLFFVFFFSEGFFFGGGGLGLFGVGFAFWDFLVICEKTRVG